jgi:hypothetical protein
MQGLLILFFAENMLFYSEKHIISGEYIYEGWEPELVKHVLSFFHPDNMRVDILSRSFDKQSQGNQSILPVFSSMPGFLNTRLVQHDASCLKFQVNIVMSTFDAPVLYHDS